MYIRAIIWRDSDRQNRHEKLLEPPRIGRGSLNFLLVANSSRQVTIDRTLKRRSHTKNGKPSTGDRARQSKSIQTLKVRH